MGLITYTNLEDDTTADANKFNTRFGAIIDEVNGNLDSANLKNGAVTTSKLADGAVTSAKMDTDQYIDANGWTVTDVGGVLSWRRSWALNSVTVPPLTQGVGFYTVEEAVNLPEGLSDDQGLLIQSDFYGGYGGRMFPALDTGNGAVGTPVVHPRLLLVNMYPTAISGLNGVVTMQIDKDK